MKRPLWLLLSLLPAVALAQSQQNQCTVNAGVPPIVRSQGLAELTGDVVLQCSGTNTGSGVTVNLQLFLNTNITSRVRPFSTTQTEALLLLDEPGSSQGPAPVLGTNVFQGTINGSNSLGWTGIQLAPPNQQGQFSRTIRITNVRANANALGAGGSSVPTQIVAFVSLTGAQSIAVSNPQQTVGFIQSGMQPLAVRNCADTGPASAAFQQCNGQNGQLAANPSAAGTAQLLLKFTEAFATAFKPQGGLNQTVPGNIYGTESGLTLFGAGQASQGTRLIARFSNVPAGVQLFVGTAQTASEPSATAVLVATDAQGSEGVAGSPIPATGTASCPNSFTGRPIAQIPVTAGTASAVWEITAASNFSIESLSFAVAVAYSTDPNPSVGAASVTGDLAPLSTVTTASATAPTPRFAASGSPSAAFSIAVCTTQPLVITTASPLPGGSLGIAYSAAFQASGGTPAYRWSIVQGSPPAGLTLNSTTGQFSGTPTQSGTFNFTVFVVDATNTGVTKAFSWPLLGRLPRSRPRRRCPAVAPEQRIH